MLDKKIMLLAIFLVSLLAVSAVSAADNSTDDIAGATNDNQAVSVNENGTDFKDLSDEIDSVSSGGVINLTKDYTYNSGSKDGIIINKTITIEGNNHKLDANGQSRIFTTYDGNITLNNLILVNGFSKLGGAIFANKSITLNNVIFENNRAESQGGAVYVGTSLNATDCVFDSNFAVEGAAIYINSKKQESYELVGPGMDDDHGDFNESINSTDIDNSTDLNQTGNVSDSGDDEFIDNESGNYSDEIIYDSIISNSIFKNSHGLKFGMIYCNADQRVSIINSTFENSTSKYFTAISTSYSGAINVTDSKFRNLYADHTGGAIGILSLADLYLNNCEFVNVSSFNNAGAVYVDANSWNQGNIGETIINRTVFKDCSSNFGGAFVQMAGQLYVYNSEFFNNCANYSAGALFVSTTMNKVVISNSTFANNRLKSAEIFGNGGAIYADALNISLSNSTFKNNSKNAIYLYDCKYDVSDSTFVGNGVAVRGVYSTPISLKGNNYTLDEVIENSSDESAILIVNATGMKLNLINNSITVESLPSSFDSRQWGWVSSVKDQGISGGCWVFSTLSTLEAALLKSTGIEYNLSVNSVQKNLLMYSKYGNTQLVEAGFTRFVLEYLVSWFGVIPAELEQFDEAGKISVPKFSSDMIHVQDAVLVPPRKNLTDNDRLKWTVLNYGGVTTDIFVEYKAPYFNENTSAFYYNGSDEHISHAVAIVGWDDNYPASNFLITPPGDGAWIIKNSYGPNKYDNGFIYISYWDTVIATDGEGVGFVFNNDVSYNKNYQTDIGGAVTIFTNTSDYVYKNSYRAIGDDFISAVGTYFAQKDEDYTLQIYVNDELKTTQSGLAPFRGFHTIKLDTYVPLKVGDNFTVVMKTHSIPLLNESRQHFAANVSFMDDGRGWQDVSLLNQTVVLKAYTTPLVNLTFDVTVGNVVSVYNGGKYLQVLVKDVYGDVVSGVNVKVELSNGVTKTFTTDKNGLAKMSVDGLAVKTYAAAVSVEGIADYAGVTKQAKITIKKATPKLTAKAKSFKKSVKTKKYTVVLKTNRNKVMKNTKVTLKVKGKTYTAKTNAKGKATFKITKLTKKGKFTATIKFAGNKYYNAKSVKAKITVK